MKIIQLKNVRMMKKSNPKSHQEYFWRRCRSQGTY